MKIDKKTITMVAMVFAIIFSVMIALVPMQKKNEFKAKWGKLAELSQIDERAKFITENEELYPEEILDIFYSNGEDYLQFVYDYPQHNGDYADMTFTEQELNCTEIPPLYMDDSRWAYEDNCRVRFNGCAAVSLTMASLYLTHNSGVDPVKIMRYADDMGYIGVFGGITDECVVDLCSAFGLNAKVIKYSENREKISHANFDEIKSILDNGHVIMAGMAGKTFGVHAIIIKRYSDDEIYINDPASEEKTKKVWKFDDVEPELMYIYDLYV